MYLAFESLSDKLSAVFKKLKGHGKLSEGDIKSAMREVKLALLEADVNYKVVKEFVSTVSERCVGSEVLESLTPGQQVIKIVRDELTSLLGSVQSKLTFSQKLPTVYMMAGLQGAGKTTTSAKLAGILRKQGKRPLLVACDVYRPAAILQLEVVGKSLDIPVFKNEAEKNPVNIAKAAIDHAKAHLNDVVIIDTAGRLHIDEVLMEELQNIKKEVVPTEILLVIDAMTGQDAASVAKSFNETLGIDGVIVTKLDGDTRGGGALSIKAVTGKPIKYVGMGEKLNELEPFYPDRMASRILGMGDVLSFIEKAQENFDEKKALELEKKLRSEKFTLSDYLDQLEQIKNMGPISSLIGMIPGVNASALKNVNIDDKLMLRTEAIIKSMTVFERENPSAINSSRKKRIADGSGTRVQDVNNLLKQFTEMQKMIKRFGNMKGNKRMKMNFPFM